MMHARVTTLDIGLRGSGILGVATAADGTLFVCTATALFSLAPGSRHISPRRPTPLAGHETEKGFVDGEGTEARFGGLQADCLSVDPIGGGVLLVDTWNNALRKVSRSGTVYTLAAYPSVRMTMPRGIAVNTHGSIFIADTGSHSLIRVVIVDGHVQVSLLAGNDNGEAGCVDGVGNTARFNMPCGLAATDDHLIVADFGNDCIRKVTTSDGKVSTVAGCSKGFADGESVVARFNRPQAVAVDGKSTILVADRNNHRIRAIKAGHVTTLAGSGHGGSEDGAGHCARFFRPCALSLDQRGRLFIAEREDRDRLRIIQTDLPWEFARVLYIGWLKPVEGARCGFALLPHDDAAGKTCKILASIIALVRIFSTRNDEERERERERWLVRRW